MNLWKTSLALLCLSSSAWSQEPVGPPPAPAGAGGDPRAEMLELFRKVELRLREIDDLLYDASAGRAGIGGVEESGIGDLLESSIEGGERVLEDIDRIIEIAEQQGGQCSSCLNGSSQSDSQSESQQQQKGGQKEQTPEQPGSQERGPEPEPDERPGRPERPEASPDRNPRNTTGDAPPQEDGERVQYVDDIERWGHLPVHVREVFRSEGGGTLPPQYRDWIEAYYKRLNRTP